MSIVEKIKCDYCNSEFPNTKNGIITIKGDLGTSIKTYNNKKYTGWSHGGKGGDMHFCHKGCMRGWVDNDFNKWTWTKAEVTTGTIDPCVCSYINITYEPANEIDKIVEGYMNSMKKIADESRNDLNKLLIKDTLELDRIIYISECIENNEKYLKGLLDAGREKK